MIRKLHCFMVTAEYGSLTKAGDVLFMSQSAVSQQVSSLEKHLGVKLFERQDNGVVLTPAGSILFKKGKPLLNEMEKLYAEVSSIDTVGAYRLQLLYDGTKQDPLVVPILQEIAKEHPDIEIRIDLFSDTIDRIAMLKDGRADAMTGRRQPPTRSGELGFVPLCITRVLAVIPEEHPLAKQELIHYVDLENEPLILMDDVFSFAPTHSSRGKMRHQPIHNELRIRHKKPELISKALTTKAALTLCKAGKGIALVDSGWIPNTDGLVCRPFENPDEIELGVCFSPDNNNPALAIFLETAQTIFADKPLFGPNGELTAPC